MEVLVRRMPRRMHCMLQTVGQITQSTSARCTVRTEAITVRIQEFLISLLPSWFSSIVMMDSFGCHQMWRGIMNQLVSIKGPRIKKGDASRQCCPVEFQLAVQSILGHVSKPSMLNLAQILLLRGMPGRPTLRACFLKRPCHPRH
jgi:hypothetical protein